MNPGIYIFKHGDEPLYIGSTRDLSKRPLKRDKGHISRFAAIMQSDNTELIPCESFLEAQRKEEHMIMGLRPIYNLRTPYAEADLERTKRIIWENW